MVFSPAWLAYNEKSIMIQIKNIIKITIFVSAIFFLAISVWYSPSLFKSYTPHTVSDQIILGRNLAQTGVYGAENDLNVLLSSNLVKDQAHTSATGDKLSATLYGKLFKIIGPLSEEGLVLFSISLYALTLVILTLITLYLFGFNNLYSSSTILIGISFSHIRCN